MKIKRTLLKILTLYLPLLCALAFVLVPIYWMIITAFKEEANVLRRPAQYLPNPVTLDNIIRVWSQSGFSVYFKNTFFVSVITAAIVVVLSILSAYALSRYHFKGKKVFFLILLITQMFPGAMLVVPLFMIFNKMGLISSLWALIFSYSAIQVPFNIILMKNFVDGVPFEIEEAGMIDGCGRFGVIMRIVFPLLVPGVVAIATFAFMGSWNEFIFPIMFINKQSRFVLSVGLSYMIGQNTTYFGALAAGSLIAISVPIILFAFFQKYIVQGLSDGAVKS